MSFLSRYKILFFLFVATFILAGTFISIKIASGYRFDFKLKSFVPRGLLVTISYPYGAEVFINGKLKGATNSNFFLSPNKYSVEIKKAGFKKWQKTLTIYKELVTKAEANLFLEIPDLRPLTFPGALNPQLSPDESKIIYSLPLPELKSPEATNTAILKSAGLWILDLGTFPFNISRSPKQIAQSKQSSIDFAKLAYQWTPDSRQILVTDIDQNNKIRQYFFEANQFTENNKLIDTSNILPQSVLTWQNEEKIKHEAKMQKLPKEMSKILNDHAKNIIFGSDNTKVLYTATSSAEIQTNLIPAVLAASTQKEEKKIQAGKTYVYDLSEDKNFLIPYNAPSPTPTPKKQKNQNTTNSTQSNNLTVQQFPKWFPVYNQLYWIENDKVVLCEYDGTNLITLYSGPFISPFVFASPGGEKLIILAKLNLEEISNPNLYTVTIK